MRWDGKSSMIINSLLVFCRTAKKWICSSVTPAVPFPPYFQEKRPRNTDTWDCSVLHLKILHSRHLPVWHGCSNPQVSGTGAGCGIISGEKDRQTGLGAGRASPPGRGTESTHRPGPAPHLQGVSGNDQRTVMFPSERVQLQMGFSAAGHLHEKGERPS